MVKDKSNYALVEGPWKNFTFRRVLPEDYDKVIKHIQDYFLHDEPFSSLIGYTEEYGKEFATLARQLFEDGLSFWIEDNETGEVAGVRVTFHHTRDTKFDVPMNSRALKYIFKEVCMVNEKVDLFEYYGIDEYADFFVASTASKYRNQGLASEMYRRCLKFLAAEGYKMAKSVFNSPYSRAAAIKLGFEEVGRVYFSEVMQEDGTPVFDPKILNEEHYGAQLCGRLQPE